MKSKVTYYGNANRLAQRPMFTNAALRQLIIPLILEQLLAMTVGLAAVVMITKVGESAVSGVSLVDSLNVLIISILSALCTGGAVVCAQYIGRQRTGERAHLRATAGLYLVDLLPRDRRGSALRPALFHPSDLWRGGRSSRGKRADLSDLFRDLVSVSRAVQCLRRALSRDGQFARFAAMCRW